MRSVLECRSGVPGMSNSIQADNGRSSESVSCRRVRLPDALISNASDQQTMSAQQKCATATVGD